MYKRHPQYHISNEAGFTLLEVIAVLVILSILAVVAVPKYFDLQGQAREKAMDMAVAEATARVNSYFGTQLLAGYQPSEIVYSTDTIGGTDPDPTNGKYNMGDFHLEVVQEGNDIVLTITPHDPAFGASFEDRKERIPNPGGIAATETPTPTPTPTPGG